MKFSINIWAFLLLMAGLETASHLIDKMADVILSKKESKK